MTSMATHGSGLKPRVLRGDHIQLILWLLLAPVAVYAPKATVIWLGLIVLSSPRLPTAMRALRRYIHSGIFLALGLLFIWGLISLIWSPEPFRGAVTLAKLIGLSLVGLLAIAEVKESSFQERRSLRIGVAGFAVLLVCLLGIEILFGGKIGALIKGPQPYRSELLFATNASAILSLFAIPVSALMITQKGKAWEVVGPTAAALIVIAFLPMFASLAALVIGCAAFGAVWFFGRRTVWFIALLGVLVTASAPVVVNVDGFRRAVESRITDVPTSWQHRLLIWEFATRKSLERPILGHGLDSSRVIGRDAGQKPVFTRSSSWKESVLPLHPHSLVLQLWLELGAVGVVLGIVALSAMVRAITSLAPDRPSRAALTGVLMVAWIIAANSFGAWQSWWIAALWLCALASVLLVKERECLGSN